MSIELYSSIDELIEKEEKAGRDPADYCFDEAWLRYLIDCKELKGDVRRKAKNALKADGDVRSIAIVCAAVEIGETLIGNEHYYGFAGDGGNVQNNMYELLTAKDELAGNCQTCNGRKGHCDSYLYSRDWLTNFCYVLRMCIHLLENKKDGPEKNHCFKDDTYKGDKKAGRRGNCVNSEMFRRGLKMYKRSIEIAYKGGVPLSALYELCRRMNKLAFLSSALGNYGCIPFELDVVSDDGVESTIECNSSKAISFLVTADESGSKYYINDQFALFLEFDWDDIHLAPKGETKVKQWKNDMLIDCCEGYYKQAAWYYKQAFISTTQKQRIANFTEYLRYVNAAIEIRSEQIVKTIKDPKKSKSAQTK